LAETLFSFYHFPGPNTLGGSGTATSRSSPPFSLLIIDRRIFLIIDWRLFLISGLRNELKSMMSRVHLSMMIEENDHQGDDKNNKPPGIRLKTTKTMNSKVAFSV
jgi:hypothetical protein